MYKCQVCGKTTEPKQSRLYVSIQRPVTYASGHKGRETVKEVNVCSNDCAQKVQS